VKDCYLHQRPAVHELLKACAPAFATTAFPLGVTQESEGKQRPERTARNTSSLIETCLENWRAVSHSLVGLGAVVAVSGLGKVPATHVGAGLIVHRAVPVAGCRLFEALLLLLRLHRLLWLLCRRRVRGLHGHIRLLFGRKR